MEKEISAKPMTREEVDRYVQWCWENFEMDSLNEAYRAAVLAMYSVAKEIASRERMILRGRLGELAEYFQFEHEDVPKFTEKTPFPRCKLTSHNIKGESFIQLSYDGLLPLYFEKKKYSDKEKDAEMRRYAQEIKKYYFDATADAGHFFERNKQVAYVERSFMYICYFFDNLIIRDLDNRNRSILINAARYGGFIKSDNWRDLVVMEEGFLDVHKKPHVAVFISDRKLADKVVHYVNQLFQDGHDFRG